MNVVFLQLVHPQNEFCKQEKHFGLFFIIVCVHHPKTISIEMKKVVLAFSGGLDTSFCAVYLSKIKKRRAGINKKGHK